MIPFWFHRLDIKLQPLIYSSRRCWNWDLIQCPVSQTPILVAQVASMILNRKELEFYRYDGDYKPMLENVRDRLNEVAASWTREQKDHCLEETEKSFKVRELEHSIPAITEWREASPQEGGDTFHTWYRLLS